MKYRLGVRSYFANGARPYVWISGGLYTYPDAMVYRSRLLSDEPGEILGVDVWLVPV